MSIFKRKRKVNPEGLAKAIKANKSMSAATKKKALATIAQKKKQGAYL